MQWLRSTARSAERPALQMGNDTDFDAGLSPALVAAREHTRMVAKWGAIHVDGMDQHRAEAIGLQPLVKQIGYATNTQELPLCLRDPGNSARFVRRTAELLLQNCTVWKEIEINCRETNAYYKEQLTVARVHEEAFRTAADILGKIQARLGLLKVWELSCPGLLQSKTRELELQVAGGQEGTPVYLDTLKEKMRIDIVYDAVAHLKKIEDDRPIRVPDVEVKQAAVAVLAKEQQDKIMLQEAQLAQELKDIGDGGDTILDFDGFLQASLPTNVLHLQSQQLLGIPIEIFQMTHLEILDLSHNAIPELPAEVGQLLQLKKLYLDDNKLRTLPGELHKLSTTLIMVGCANNPLEENLMQIYLAGLPNLLAHLKGLRRAQRKWKGNTPQHHARPGQEPQGITHGPTGASGGNRGGDLYTTRLPDYSSNESQPMAPPPPVKPKLPF